MIEKITIFTLDGCSHCFSLKNRLNDLNINYKEIEVSSNPHIWEEILKHTKHDYLPTIMICTDNSTNANLYVPSINYKTEDEIVEIIKKSL